MEGDVGYCPVGVEEDVQGRGVGLNGLVSLYVSLFFHLTFLAFKA